MKLLVVDDNQSVLRTLKLVLASEFDTIAAVSPPQLIPALLAPGDVDAVLLDMNFGTSHLDGRDGLFWLGRIKEKDNAPAVVMITAFGELSLAVEAMKAGAEDFVTKPWDNQKLIEILHRAVARNRDERQRKAALAQAAELCRRDEAERRMSLDDIKLSHIRRIVDECGGNLSQAAEILNINRQTLYNQLRKK